MVLAGSTKINSSSSRLPTSSSVEALKERGEVRLIYPARVTLTKVSSSTMRLAVSISIVLAVSCNSLRRGLPKSFLTSRNSFFIRLNMVRSSPMMAAKVAICSLRLACSSSKVTISVLVKRYNCKVTIASACSSVKS